jgi:hypothetical protein
MAKQKRRIERAAKSPETRARNKRLQEAALAQAEVVPTRDGVILPMG